MVKATMDIRTKAVLFYMEGLKRGSEICSVYGISDRTLRRWKKLYESEGLRGLQPKKTGPRHAKHSISYSMEERILRLEQRHPPWGARRIKYQYDLPCHWKTVHNVIKRHGMLVRVKPKPQPSKRFQRRHVDSMWQGDTFQFRISGVGKVYVTGFTDDRSRYRVASCVYLRKGKEEAIDALHNALKRGRVPKEIYLDNAKQFIAEDFKEELAKHRIKPIYGKPYHPRGRSKIEEYHKILYRELITAVRFSSLPHFKRELGKFDRKYNYWRKQQTMDGRLLQASTMTKNTLTRL